MITTCKKCKRVIKKEVGAEDLCISCLIKMDKKKFHPLLEKEIFDMRAKQNAYYIRQKSK